MYIHSVSGEASFAFQIIKQTPRKIYKRNSFHIDQTSSKNRLYCYMVLNKNFQNFQLQNQYPNLFSFS